MTVGLIAALAVVGILLLALEIVVIPGFGVSGILGIAALITSVVLAADSVAEAILYSAITLSAVGVITYVLWKNGFLDKRLFLAARQSRNEGYVAPKVSFEEYMGRCGRALTPLRPAGTADFDGERLDVVTEGGFIQQGSLVKIVAVEGARIIVREVTEPVKVNSR